jgi:type IV pilus assembly protein PilC/MSHA biogenesis protein MshG
MPVFQYTVLNPQGQTERGLMQSTSLESALSKLQEKGFTIKEIGVAPGSGDPFEHNPASDNSRMSFGETVASQVGPLVTLVSLADLHFFFRQLATMLSAGINPGHSLETLARQTSSPRLRTIIAETKPMVMEGKTLSEGLERYPDVFSPLMLSLLRAGEHGGFVPEACGHLSDYIKEEIDLRNLIRKETAYPKIVIFLSMFIVLAVNMVLTSIGSTQPGMRSPLTDPMNWLCIGPMIVGIFLFIRIGLRQEQIKKKWQQFLLKLPAFGDMVHGFAMAKFGRAFGALYKGAVPIPHAVVLAAEACGNEYLRDRIIPVKARLEEGIGITQAFTETGAFNPIVLDMTHTGEMTGNLDFMLTKVAEFYEEEGRIRARQWATYFGVTVFMCVAVYVAYLVITFFMQYATMTTSAGGE